jgi:methylenetetrahydrofolate dehydrogenase (NADP+) / methenyltetrahydrofolate cyclohydrolase
VLVGDDEASKIYVRRKGEACEEAGMASFHHELPATAAQGELDTLVDELAGDDRVHGILVQLPLPEGLDEDAVIERIPPAKDVDGLTPVNLGRLLQGFDPLAACTPSGIVELLRDAGTPIEGARAVIVGRSRLLGKPLTALLLREHATITVAHSRTRDLPAVCREADILVAAVGSPRMITGDMVREGATVIDVGINRTDEGVVGDVDFEAAKERAGAITPVPGGVGPMTIAMLLRNTLQAAEMATAGTEIPA